jgi:hypothetical protein
MRKKIILVAFCLILFLIFTALSYAKPDPRYIFQGDPWQELLSPPHPQDTTEVVLKRSVVIIVPIVRDCLIFIKSADISRLSKGEYNSPPCLKKHEKQIQGLNGKH